MIEAISMQIRRREQHDTTSPGPPSASAYFHNVFPKKNMPLVVISGLPCSGKSTRAKELQRYFSEVRNKRVYLISENCAIVKAGYDKNEYFADSQKEKVVRSDLKSEVLRVLNKEDVVILDAGNYIKGYRYELFCATKAARTTQCTLFCGIQQESAWTLNVDRKCDDAATKLSALDLEAAEATQITSDIPYTRDIFEALCLRYEEPHGNFRWDSPLFVVFPEDQIDLPAVYDALFEAKPLPPNQSTQNPPLSSTNYVFELDRLTQKIVADILAARKIGIMGPLSVQNCQTKVDVPFSVNAIQLNRLRRQFLNYSKLHHATTSSLEKVPQLFVQFLNSNCNRL